MDDRVSIRRFTAAVVDGSLVFPAEEVVRLLRELGPEGGDFVVLRATPDRAEVIERNLVAQLFTQGAYVAGEPVGPPDDTVRVPRAALVDALGPAARRDPRRVGPLMSDRIRIQIDVPALPVPEPDAELRAAAEALVLGASDDIGDLFIRGLVAVSAPALRRLAAACDIATGPPGGRIVIGNEPPS